MKIKNNIFTYTNILIFITILSIPFYSIRIDFIYFSLSVLTLNLLILCSVLLSINYKHLSTTFKRESLFWIFTAFFVLSFIIPALLYPSIHGFGVFFEWLLIPVVTTFLLLSHTLRQPPTALTLQYGMVVLLFIISSVSLVYLLLGQLTFDTRLSAFYLSPNHLAMSIAPLICITIVQIITTNSLRLKIFSSITIFLSIIILFFTNSFTSMTALIIALSIVLFIKNKQRILLFLIGFLCLILIIFIGYFKYTHISHNIERSSLASRYEIWLVATDYIQKNPLITKSPIDTFQDIYLEQQQFYNPYLHWSAPTPHNLLLTLWISGGIFTILFFCLLSTRWLYISFSNYSKTKNTAILLYIAAFLVIIFTGILDTPYWKNDLAFIFWIILILGILFKK